MKALTTRAVLILAVLFSIGVLPASATHVLEAEITCDGIYSPGDRVPFLLDFENRSNSPITVDYTVSISLPNGRDLTLLQRSITLQPDQNRTLRLALRMPRQAPPGRYMMAIDATGGGETSGDTCSFHLQ